MRDTCCNFDEWRHISQITTLQLTDFVTNLLRHDNIISIFLLRLVSSLTMCGKPPQSDVIKLKVTKSVLENH